MKMLILELPGKITQNGTLEVELPAGLPAGDIMVRIELPGGTEKPEDQPWTDEEIQKLMTRKKTFQELAAWLRMNPPSERWGNLGEDEDAATYIHKLRHQASFTLDDK